MADVDLVDASGRVKLAAARDVRIVMEAFGRATIPPEMGGEMVVAYVAALAKRFKMPMAVAARCTLLIKLIAQEPERMKAAGLVRVDDGHHFIIERCFEVAATCDFGIGNNEFNAAFWERLKEMPN